MMRGYGYSYGPGMMGSDTIWVGLLMLLFWGVILVGAVLLIVWAIRQPHRGAMMPPPGMSGPMTMQQHDEAMAIARRRLASGEITKEQFEEIRMTLGG